MRLNTHWDGPLARLPDNNPHPPLKVEARGGLPLGSLKTLRAVEVYGREGYEEGRDTPDEWERLDDMADLVGDCRRREQAGIVDRLTYDWKSSLEPRLPAPRSRPSSPYTQHATSDLSQPGPPGGLEKLLRPYGGMLRTYPPPHRRRFPLSVPTGTAAPPRQRPPPAETKAAASCVALPPPHSTRRGPGPNHRLRRPKLLSHDDSVEPRPAHRRGRHGPLGTRYGEQKERGRNEQQNLVPRPPPHHGSGRLNSYPYRPFHHPGARL